MKGWTVADTQTVLVVDDAPENLDLMKAILAPHYKVKLAINGEAALRLVAAGAPDIVLLDVMMPGMDGYEVCRRIKADPLRRDLPVLLVSAMSEAADEGRGCEAGAADFITKPVSAPVVLARVRSQLALRRLAAAAAAALARLGGAGAAPELAEALAATEEARR